MEILKGNSANGGIAIGKTAIFQKKENRINRRQIIDTDQELRRFEAARLKAIQQLKRLYEKALGEVGESNAMIFEVHQMMLDDSDFIETIKDMIVQEKTNAEFAAMSAGKKFAARFTAMDNDYMKERAADVQDITKRVTDILSGFETVKAEYEEPVVLLAEDLAPSDTLQLDKSKILSIVTRLGSANSHTAILARAMNIPALVNVNFEKSMEGKRCIVDGNEGCFYVEPSHEILSEYERKKQGEEQVRQKLLELKGKESITKDGRKVELFANIGQVSDAQQAIENDAAGIGLFRSEFLYLESMDYPSEEIQFQAYKSVAEQMAGKKVIIRTLDIGADKQADYFHLEHEENPALGYRAIRICLTQKQLFKTQLRAIYRASPFGNVSIMFPMITSLEEIREAKAVATEVTEELKNENILTGKVELGIMIETPAAAIISDLLAQEVDFFSIGTNDLTQYTLAIDRQNPKLKPFLNPYHESLKRLIKLTIDNGHKENCWVGICGELGADLRMTEWLLRNGIDEISVSPSMILKVRNKIRSLDLK